MEDQILDIPQVSPEENVVLISEFTESEVRDAVFQMELMDFQLNFTKSSRM